MSGNSVLRSALDEAVTTKYPELYRETIERLRREFGHSITILPVGKGRTTRFNCFAFGLGVWEHPDFIRLVDAAGNSAILNSTIVQAMIDDETLRPVEASEARPGDVVAYFRAGKLAHAAILAGDDLLCSKWGGDEVHSHRLWEVPAEYGNRVRYFHAPVAETVLARITPPDSAVPKE